LYFSKKDKKYRNETSKNFLKREVENVLCRGLLYFSKNVKLFLRKKLALELLSAKLYSTSLKK